MRQCFSAWLALVHGARRGGTFIVLLGLVTLLTACGQTEPSRLYTLADLSGTTINSTNSGALAIGLGPVTFPGYLDRPQIVVRQSIYRLETAEFDRWAEPLKDTIPRILAENLSFLLESDEVYIVPGRIPRDVDLVISIEFLRFEAMLDGDVVLVARWEILDPQGERRLSGGRAVVSRSGAAPEDYESLVALLSDALGDFAQTLVAEIQAMRG